MVIEIIASFENRGELFVQCAGCCYWFHVVLC